MVEERTMRSIRECVSEACGWDLSGESVRKGCGQSSRTLGNSEFWLVDKSHRETEEQCHLTQEKSMERTGSQELGEIFFQHCSAILV